MKVAFLGYDFFYGCLEQIVNNGWEVHWVYSFGGCDNRKYNFNVRVRSLAERIGAQFTLSPVNGDHITHLKRQGCDLLLVAAYPHKVPIHREPSLRGVNIHPSLLPVGRGPWPLPWTILNDLPESGVSIHKLTSQMDTGDILIQRQFKLSADENLETLSCKAQMCARDLTELLTSDFDSLWRDAKPQLGQPVTWRMPGSDVRTLNWTNGVRQIDRVARAFGKFDSFAVFDGKEWIVQDVSVWVAEHNIAPGTVVHRTNREVVIAVSDGYTCLRYYDIDPEWKEQ